MRFGASISLLCAVASLTPLAFAAPVASDSTGSFEARAFDAEVADLVARSDFDEATSLLARAVADVLSARTDPPNYHKHDPNNGKKPKYSEKDPNGPPKYRQKDPHKKPQPPKPKPGPSRPRDLAALEDALFTRTDPPNYHKHDPNNGKKPKYSEKDPNGPPKYRQKDPHKKPQPPKPKPGPSRPRDLAEVDGLWEREFDEELWAREDLEEMWAREVEDAGVFARTDPPNYHRHDPNNGKKPKYSEKDPNGPPKYRRRDLHKKPQPPQPPQPKRGASRPRELLDSWW
ncbi:hypothetical protein EVJ58_g1624 [Rhodofomes roseus]|uniref:Uncharacterized protein n=1 Tax=Rhodofomes roseus TaxID=34475 RepID=A0A4Y9YXU1_9APHY|nr:hypothetical protein EVJ58_g1624 [Rhodofomes roseus]